jgi:hypothetical protein
MGPEGFFAVCFVGPVFCVGLLAGSNQEDGCVVDVSIEEFQKSFPVRVMVAESINEAHPETRAQ